MKTSFKDNLFKDKVVLISGGATGICYGISKLYLQLGATVFIISRKIKNIQIAINKLRQETGNNNIDGRSCDVRNEKQIQQTIKQIIKKYNNIHILINGAAGNFLCPFQKLSANGFKTVLMIDTVGTFLLSKYTSKYGFKQSGVIINISANLHYSGTVLQTHAGTAKAGVDALTKHMAVQLGPRNIRVVGICPGIIKDTEGYVRLNVGSTTENIQKLVPLQKLGKSSDIAQCACFLSSQSASYITGITIAVDGGHTLTSVNFPFFSSDFVQSYSKGQLVSKL